MASLAIAGLVTLIGSAITNQKKDEKIYNMRKTLKKIKKVYVGAAVIKKLMKKRGYTLQQARSRVLYQLRLINARKHSFNLPKDILNRVVDSII